MAVDALIDIDDANRTLRMLQHAALSQGADPTAVLGVTVLDGTSASEGVEGGAAPIEDGDASTDTDTTEFDMSQVTWERPTEESLAADLAMLGAIGGNTTITSAQFDESPDLVVPDLDEQGMEWL